MLRRVGRSFPAAVRAFDRANARHPWSHNDHYHGWVLRRLPRRRRLAVDVGCGRGLLAARLSEHVAAVIGLDRDAGMVAEARRSYAGPRVRIVQAVFPDVDLPTGEVDLVTMVASLHHLDTALALSRCRDLLAPGGRLLVVGLSRPQSVLDGLWESAALLLNPLMGMVRHPRVAPAEGHEGPPMPVQEASLTYAEVAAVAASELPGARLRRRLFFRYTLEWTKPDPRSLVARSSPGR